MIWTLKYDGVEKPLAEWGFAGTTRTLVSHGLDELTAEVAVRSFAGSEVIPFGGIVEVWRDRTVENGAYSGGTRFFYGRRVLATADFDEVGRQKGYTFAGPWHWLQEIVFQQGWKIWTGSGLATRYSSHLMLNVKSDGTKATTAEQISTVLEWAIESGAPLQIGEVNLPTVYPPVSEVRAQRCADVILDQLRWHPDAIVWLDYAAEGYPKIYVQSRTALDTVDLSLDGTRVKAGRIIPRPDRQRSCVYVVYEQVHDEDGQQYLTVTKDFAPAECYDALTDDLKTRYRLGALVLTFDLQGSKTTHVRGTIKAEAHNAASEVEVDRLAWWRARFPNLDSDRIANLSIPVEKVTRTSELPRMLSPDSGSVAPWMGVTVEEDTVTAEISYDHYADAAHTKLVAKVRGALKSVKVKATDAPLGESTYSSLQSGEAAEPVPVGVAQYLYQALSVLQYEGDVRIEERDVGGEKYLGCLLNVTGGDPAWATMQAQVKRVVENIGTGVTDVTIGAPGILAPGDLIELLRVGRVQRRWNAMGMQSSGEWDAGSEVELPEDAPQESASGTHEGTSEQYHRDESDPVNCYAQIGPKVVKTQDGETKTVTLDLSDIPSDAGNKVVKVREILTCEGGVEKYRLIVCSEAYEK